MIVVAAPTTTAIPPSKANAIQLPPMLPKRKLCGA
jgi:hypothetical protein